jgi:hypothetical protein
MASASGISSDLSPVGKMPEQSFRPKNRGELCSDTFQVHQHLCWSGIRLVRRGEYVIPVGLNSLDLFENQLKPVEFAVDLPPQMLGQWPPIAPSQFRQPRPPVAAQWRVRDTL